MAGHELQLRSVDFLDGEPYPLISLSNVFTYTSRSSTFLPNAAAYFLSVLRLGECLPVDKALSSRATAGA